MEILAVILGVLIAIVGLFGVCVFFSIIDGFVVSTLWSWFAVEHFHLAPMPIAVAMGLSLLVRHLTLQDVDCEPKKRETSEQAARICVQLAKPFIVLTIGWIIHQFV